MTASLPPAAPTTEVSSIPSADALAEVLVELGPEVAAPLAQALERLHAQIARQSGGDAQRDGPLLALREPLRRARDAALLASQVGRLASGRVVPAQEQCPLHTALRQVVDTRRREAQSRGLQLRLDATDAVVGSDPVLLSSLLHALLDWALWHTRSSIELNLALTAWPPHARLRCKFALRDLDQLGSVQPSTLDGLRWMLIIQTARALGVQVFRDDEAGLCVARLEFPLLRREVQLELPSSAATGIGAQDTQPFAGWLCIVVGSDAEFHREVTSLMEPLGWALDRVDSVDEAFQHCLSALPQAIVVDGRLAGADLNQWRCHVFADAPGFCFIEVDAQPTDRPSKPDTGLHCTRAHMARELPALLRSALAPPGEALTFRL